MTEFNERNGGEDFSLVRIPAGSFLMGSADSDPEVLKDNLEEEVQHEVVISRPFLMFTTPVTQKVWTKVMGSNPSEFKGDNLPVVCVSWFDAVVFCNKLSELEGLKPAYRIPAEIEALITEIGLQQVVESVAFYLDVHWDRDANGYRLPTEAEWEYACRAGTTTVYNTGDSYEDIERAGWFAYNSEKKTQPVGRKEPNAWSLYDMHGNVAEWCWDWHDKYPSDKVTDPTGPSTGLCRVVRGGTYSDDHYILRSAHRSLNYPVDEYGPKIADDLGFRPVKSAP